MAPHGRGHGYEKVPSKEVELSKLEEGAASQKKAAPNSLYASKTLTAFDIVRVLSPYFWPAEGSDGALINRIRSTSTWVMVALSKTCSLTAPVYLSYSTDALVNKQYTIAAKYMAVFALLRFLSSFFKEMQSIVYIKVKQQASIELQDTTFAHIHSLSLQWHLSKKTGSVMKSMDRGVDAANQIISYLFLFLMPAVLECLAVMVLFLVRYGQWALSLLVFAGVVLYSALTISITQWRKQFREQSNKHDNDFHDKATDSITNYETVKYFTAEDYERQRFKDSVIQYQKYNSSTQLSLSLLNISQQLVLGLTVLGVMLIAGKQVVAQKMTLGAWIAVQTWVASIFVPLNFLGSVYSSILQAFIDIQNLSELLANSPDVVDVPNAPALQIASSNAGASVAFKNVTFRYPGQDDLKGLHNVSFSIAAGTSTAVIGHTGAGKTTISRLLFRFFDPVEGSICIDGHPIRQYSQQSVRKLIGIVPQDTVLFNDTILYNIQYGNRKASFQEVEKAAEAAQIKSFIESLPDGWNSMVGERGLKLSGGEKQRIAIARCLLKDPPIVLLDEATSALDTVTESSIQLALTALGRNRTMIIIAHRLSTIKNVDQILVMEDGRVVEQGNHDQLSSNQNSVYRKMLQVQMHVDNS